MQVNRNVVMVGQRLGWTLGVCSVSEAGLVLVDRDKKIIRELDRWRVVQGRHNIA